MSAEVRKVLEMLAEKKISVEDAEKLLAKLRDDDQGASSPAAASASEEGKKPRFLRIVVDKPGEKPVNVRVPLSFTRAGARLLAVLPIRVSEKLAEAGIDVAALGCDEKLCSELVEGINMDVENGDKKVRIFCE